VFNRDRYKGWSDQRDNARFSLGEVVIQALFLTSTTQFFRIEMDSEVLSARASAQAGLAPSGASKQALPGHEEVDDSEGDKQACGVLQQPSVSDLGESESAIQDVEWMLHA
jgi:hypothetical protein